MTKKNREKEIELVEKIFKKLQGSGTNDGLRGIPLYVAFMHSAEGPKILEINSRGGDPEIINVLAVLKNDLVDLCFDMINNSLKKVSFEKKATVLTYKVPASYGGFSETFPEKVKKDQIGKAISLDDAYKLAEMYGNFKIYPGSIELRDGKNYALGSRTVASVGIAETIEEARQISLKGLHLVAGGALWHRDDIASKEHIQKSIEHMKKLRR